MRGDEILTRGDILIDGHRIAAVGPSGSLTVPDGTVTRDVSGMTITPGFVDTHAHLRPPSGIHTTQPWGYLANLAFGVTTTRDPQTGVSDVLTYGDRVRSGDILGPRIYSTGPGVFGDYQPGEGIRDLDHARDVLRRYSDYYDTKTFKMYLAGNRQQRQWLIMAARELELMPTTEAGLDFQLDLTHAMDGYPGIEHNLPVYPLYRDVVRLFSETKVLNTPTLIVSFGGPMGEIYWFTHEDVHGNERLARFTPHETLDQRTRRRAGASGAVAWAVDEEYVFEDHARFLRDVVADGGYAGVGSHGQLQGLGFHWELWMVASGGMSNHDALRAATIFGANGIGLETEIGSIEPGKLADLVILSGNPLDDLRNTLTVEQVMMNGRLFNAETLDEVWPRQRALGYKGFVGGMAQAGLGNGWECLYANDVDENKTECYAQNWGEEHLHIGDVRNVEVTSLPGRADLVWASFPCQDLSLAGNGRGLGGARSGTFWPFWKLVEALRDGGRVPRVVVLENVCGALTSHGGKDFAAIIEAVAGVGYLVGAMVIDAIHFVPQSRQRLFIIGVQDSVRLPAHLAADSLPDHDLWHPPAVTKAYQRLSDKRQERWIWWNMAAPSHARGVLGDVIDVEPADVRWHTSAETAQLLQMMTPVNRRKVEVARLAGRRVVGTLYKRTRPSASGGRAQRAEVRFDVAGCLRTPTGGSSRQTVIVVNGDSVRTRLLAPREAARLMGLPDDYWLPGNYNAAYHVAGDGLVVPVVRHLAAHVIEPLVDASPVRTGVAA